jgi:predicted nucleotidyltransferase
MRLSNKYKEVIKKYFFNIFEKGEIYLFGSRVDDNKKGGDIDLYLILIFSSPDPKIPKILENEGKIPVILIEAQVGEYTGEDDIIRVEDDFERGNS